MEYVLYCSLTVLIVYGIWFFRNSFKSGMARKIYIAFQTTLDQKLLPLGFEKKEILVGGREKVVSYKKNMLEITLNYEISFDFNRILFTNGKKSNVINLSDTAETKNNLIKTLDEWLSENQ